VPIPRVAAGALSTSSCGSVAVYIVLSVYLTHVGEPARFRCGDSFPGESVPGWVAPAMAAAFAIAALGAMTVSVAARRRPAN